jgi:hypothetical protein
MLVASSLKVVFVDGGDTAVFPAEPTSDGHGRRQSGVRTLVDHDVLRFRFGPWEASDLVGSARIDVVRARQHPALDLLSLPDKSTAGMPAGSARP